MELLKQSKNTLVTPLRVIILASDRGLKKITSSSYEPPSILASPSPGLKVSSPLPPVKVSKPDVTPVYVVSGSLGLTVIESFFSAAVEIPSDAMTVTS